MHWLSISHSDVVQNGWATPAVPNPSFLSVVKQPRTPLQQVTPPSWKQLLLTWHDYLQLQRESLLFILSYPCAYFKDQGQRVSTVVPKLAVVDGVVGGCSGDEDFQLQRRHNNLINRHPMCINMWGPHLTACYKKPPVCVCVSLTCSGARSKLNLAFTARRMIV